MRYRMTDRSKPLCADDNNKFSLLYCICKMFNPVSSPCHNITTMLTTRTRTHITMEQQEMQHKIEVLTKRGCGSSLRQYMDWSKPMTNHRYTFQVMHRLRKRQFYQPKWKPSFIAHRSIGNAGGGGGRGRVGGGGVRDTGAGATRYNSNGSHATIWELERIDRQIQILQSQICVLKQQLRIIQTHCVPTEQQHDTSPSSMSNANNNNAATVAVTTTATLDVNHQMPNVN